MINKNRKQTFSEFFRMMLKMRRILVQAINKQDSESLTLLQLRALSRVAEVKNIKAGELASVLSMSSSAVTQLTDRMVDSALLIRTHDDVDRRSIYFSITKLGSKQLNKCLKHIEKNVGDILQPIADNDLKTVMSIFNKFIKEYEAINSKNKYA